MALRPTRIPPGPGQESVWDYPRPPRIEPTDRRVRVELGGVSIGDTTRALRVLETSQPPAFYLPPEDVAREHLERTDKHSFCEWKGQADYWTVTVGERVARRRGLVLPGSEPGLRRHRRPPGLLPAGHGRLLRGRRAVESNDGDFYGGWITSAVVGPFKGAPGTGHW